MCKRVSVLMRPYDVLQWKWKEKGKIDYTVTIQIDVSLDIDTNILNIKSVLDEHQVPSNT